LGGSNWNTPSDRIKVTDLNDTFDVLGDVTNKALGSMFNDTAQNLFNADYLGFDSKLNVTGTPNLKNVFYSTFTSNDADVNYGFVYDSTNDYYYTVNIDSETEYVIIEAEDDNVSWGSNDTLLVKIASGKWLLYGTGADTDAVKRAKIHKSLWYGTDGSNQLILDFTNITAIKTSHANDVGKQAHYASSALSGNNIDNTYTGTFTNTSTNSNCSSWCRVFGSTINLNDTARWYIPASTVRASAVGGTTDEMGTDTSSDETNNPADCKLYNDINGNGSANGKVIVLCVGGMTWEESGTSGTVSHIDFYTDHSIPLLTAVGTDSEEGLDVSTLIFKDTASASVTNAIPVINSTIDASSSEQISVSADGGSNWTDVNNAEIARPTAGTELWRRIVITRTDLSVEDKVTEQAIKYNLY
jgi:hypothetical protein